MGVYVQSNSIAAPREQDDVCLLRCSDKGIGQLQTSGETELPDPTSPESCHASVTRTAYGQAVREADGEVKTFI